MSILDEALGATATAADALSATLPFPGNIIAAIVGVALKAGEAFAKEGKDPAKEIARILHSDPAVKKVHLDWERLLDERFGRREETTPDVASPPPIDPHED
jgi:hypothetical protein